MLRRKRRSSRNSPLAQAALRSALVADTTRTLTCRVRDDPTRASRQLRILIEVAKLLPVSDDVDALYAEFQQNQADIVGPPLLRIYGMKELEVRDLDGYVICFGQDVSGAAAA